MWREPFSKLHQEAGTSGFPMRGEGVGGGEGRGRGEPGPHLSLC